MTVLADNLRTIRKFYNCTQAALSEVLDVGFRTYVRYESGERDAPISLLIQIARLGNLSLDRLLTTKIDLGDLQNPDAEKPPEWPVKLEVIGGGVEEGRLVFKGVKGDYLFCVRPTEKTLLNRFRQLNRTQKESFVQDAAQALKIPGARRKSFPSEKIPKKILKEKNATRLKRMVKNVKNLTARD